MSLRLVCEVPKEEEEKKKKKWRASNLVLSLIDRVPLYWSSLVVADIRYGIADVFERRCKGKKKK